MCRACLSQQAFRALDHDYPSWATGLVIPHGVYDLARNRGHINIGLSHDTSQFACDSFRWYWNRIGKQCYPNATSILLLCDGGGSNSASHHIFKQDLQAWSTTWELRSESPTIPATARSTTRSNGVSFAGRPRLQRNAVRHVGNRRPPHAKTSTTTGLKATVNVLRGVYELKRKVTEDFKSNMKLVFDAVLPKWNYVARPQ